MRTPARLVAVVLTAAALSACGTAAAIGSSTPTSRPGASSTSSTQRATAPSTSATTTSTTTSTTTTTTTLVVSTRPLAGVVVGLDPGHNGDNWRDPAWIDHRVWNGREWEACDTTGTATDSGYTEAHFNFDVAVDARNLLKSLGARVVMTRTSNDGVGPCITTRAELLNRAHVDVAFDIHADGGPPNGRGFTVLVPVRDAWNHRVVVPSRRLADDLRTVFRAATGMPWSTYDGVDAIQPRDDLAGLNLTTVPKVLIECGNMRNATDAAMLVSASFQLEAAHALVTTVFEFLGRPVPG